MKWKNLLIGGAFIGVFTLGAMFAPIGKPTATTTNDQVDAKNLAVVQTADEKATTEGEFTCPITGEQMGSGNGMMGSRAGMGMSFAGSNQEVIADALGMTVDELQGARSEGKSVADLAEANGVKVETLVAKMVESRKADLEALVKDGKMTQEQMDTMLKNMESMMKNAIERDTVGPMNGGQNGMMNGGKGGMMNDGKNGPMNGGKGAMMNGGNHCQENGGPMGMGQGGKGNAGAGNQQINL